MSLSRGSSLIVRHWPRLQAAMQLDKHHQACVDQAHRYPSTWTRGLSSNVSHSYETVEVSLRTGYALLTLNRPKALNALSTKVRLLHATAVRSTAFDSSNTCISHRSLRLPASGLALSAACASREALLTATPSSRAGDAGRDVRSSSTGRRPCREGHRADRRWQQGVCSRCRHPRDV